MAGPTVVAIPNGRFAENSWLIVDPESGAAVVVDPGEEPERILAVASEHGARIEQIWLTHAHIDHIWGSDVIRDATGAQVLLHKDALRWYDSLPEQGRMFGIEGIVRLAPPDRLLKHGDQLELGRFRFDARHTPGHAPGHLVFVGEGICLAGDLVFRGSVGRTDLAGCDPAALSRSIEEEILTLPDDTRLLPGHGEETTVGRERRDNPFFPGPRAIDNQRNMGNDD